MYWLTLLRRAERALLAALFLGMVALFFGNVLVREFAPGAAGRFAWIEEAVRLLGLFLAFGALGLGLERGRHVSVDLLQRRFGPAARRRLQRLIDAVGLVFSLYLVVLGIRLVGFVLASGQLSPTLGLPMGWVYLAPVIGFGLLALRFALALFGIQGRRGDAPAAR